MKRLSFYKRLFEQDFVCLRFCCVLKKKWKDHAGRGKVPDACRFGNNDRQKLWMYHTVYNRQINGGGGDPFSSAVLRLSQTGFLNTEFLYSNDLHSHQSINRVLLRYGGTRESHHRLHLLHRMYCSPPVCTFLQTHLKLPVLKVHIHHSHFHYFHKIHQHLSSSSLVPTRHLVTSFPFTYMSIEVCSITPPPTPITVWTNW